MRIRPFVIVVGLALCALPASASSDRNDDEGKAVSAELEQAVSRVYPALVRIHVVFETGDSGRMRKGRASGSGTIISPDGYVLTNHHVAGRATRITCRLSNREELDATLIGSDPLCDLAIIKLDLSSRRDPKAPLPFANFGDSDRLKIGDVVLAMGSPSGLSQSVTKGIVANTAMIMPASSDFVLDGENVGELVRWIGHDAVIYHGNSGGPLVNLQGEIVGVNEIGIATMGGAIPGNLAQMAAKELIAHGSIARSWIGLEVQPLLKEKTDGKGVLVSAILPESPAKAAGIEPGDFITNINGRPVIESRAPEDVPVFNQQILSAPIGSEMNLEGIRNGLPQKWKLTTLGRERNRAMERETSEWGLTIRDFTRVSALEKHRANKNGVIVDSVRPGGPSAESKPALKADDIILRVAEKEIADASAIAEFTKSFTEKINEPKPVLVVFERDGQELATVVKIGPEMLPDNPGRPAKAWFGAQTQVLTSELAEALGLEGKKGVRITQVAADSAAGRAGVKIGDVFLKMDGHVIAASTPSDEELFPNLIREYKVDAEVELAGMRANEPLKITVKLGRQPKPNSDLDEFKDDQFEFKARDISFNDRLSDKSIGEVKGVRIVTVQNAGWAALAGLSSGDTLLSVDGQPAETIAALKKILTKVRDSKPRRVMLFIKRGIRTQFLELEPRW